MKVVILDYGAGNVQSVSFALERLGVKPIVSSESAEISSADKVIFPGVGEASSAMKRLRELQLDNLVPSLQQPVLGICLGMQLMCVHSEEGDTDALGIFPALVRKFVSTDPGVKVPQVGWNTITSLEGLLFKGVPGNAYVYYVHSFYAEKCESTCAVTDYIQPYSAALAKNNFYGVQFHPEKSGVAGEFILRNFLAL